MWIKRTPEEVDKWHAATKREARMGGLLISGLAWAGVVVMLAGGWIAGGRVGVVAQESVRAGGFWTRLVIFACVCLPPAFWLYRKERAREFDNATRMTICPKCETAGQGNADMPCECGGTYTLQSTVRWVEAEESQPTRTGSES
jgi:hypothetical protein